MWLMTCNILRLPFPSPAFASGSQRRSSSPRPNCNCSNEARGVPLFPPGRTVNVKPSPTVFNWRLAAASQINTPSSPLFLYPYPSLTSAPPLLYLPHLKLPWPPIPIPIPIPQCRARVHHLHTPYSPRRTHAASGNPLGSHLLRGLRGCLRESC
jgi:hypothetical protein